MPNDRNIALWQSPPEQPRPVDQLIRLQFPQRCGVMLPPGDWRRLVFATGERWHVRLEADRSDREKPLHGTLRGGSRLDPFPKEMARLDPPQYGEVLGFSGYETETRNPYVSFPNAAVIARGKGNHALNWNAQNPPIESSWPESITAGGISFRFESQPGSGRCVVEFLTSHGPLRVVLASSGNVYEVYPPRAGQWDLSVVARGSGVHDFALQGHAGRWTLAIDGHLLAHGFAPGLQVTGMRLCGESVEDPSSNKPAQVMLEDLSVWKSAMPLPQLPIARNEDQVLLNDGVEVFGQLRGLQAVGVELQRGETTTSWSWEEVTRITRRQSPASPIVWSGLLVRIEAQPLAETLREESDWLWGTWTELDEQSLTLDHASLGKIRVPLAEIARIEPLHRGWSSELLPGGIHLGDEVHPEFSRVLPDATRWETKFPESPVKPVNPVLRVELSELEPSGPLADPQARFLKDLRAGRLTTELWWNDRKLAVLNSLISARAPRLRPQVLRIPVPLTDWKPNGNKISLRQEPLTDGQAQYDDCEIHSLRLELDVPAR